MTQKQAAQGTILKIDHDDNAMYDDMTVVITITPPPRDRELLEGKDLGDTFDVPILGIENQSQMSFVQFWEETDTEQAKIDTLFDDQTEVDFQMVTPHATPITQEYKGKVVNVTPAEVTVGGTYQRTVTVQRTSAITYT